MTEAERKRRMERALGYAGPLHRLSDVAALVQDGKAQWWESPDGEGMVVSEVIDYPLGSCLNYWLIAGTLPGCLSLEPEIEAWGRSRGCIVATATGRRGWTPIVTRRGWRVRGTAFYKPLQEH